MLRENPPLLGWLVYGPYRLAGVRHPAIPAGTASAISPFEYGRLFLHEAGNPHRRTLLLARGAVLGVSLGAVAVLIWWANLLHGPRGAWIAALCAGCEPSWLAHGRMAAFDGLATATITVALFGCARLLERPSWGRALAAGDAVGPALASKHTALVLLPLGVAFRALATLPGGGAWLGATAPRPAPSWLARAGPWLVVLLAALVVLGLSYGGSVDYGQYVRSVAGTYRLGRPGYDNYLLGQFRDGACPHYDVVAAAAQTPVAWLVLLALGLVATLRRRPRALWVPPVLWVVALLAVTSARPRNLGYRHLVPAVPALLLVAAGGAGTLERRGLGGVAVALARLGGAESVAQAPQHLAFSNVLAGGPDPILNRLPRLPGRDPEWLRDRPAWRKAGRSIHRYRF